MENPQPAASSVKAGEVEQGEALGGERKNRFPRFGKSRAEVGGESRWSNSQPAQVSCGKETRESCPKGGREGSLRGRRKGGLQVKNLPRLLQRLNSF